MIVLASLFLLASSAGVDLVDDPYQIPSGEWKYVEVNLRQRTATIVASFKVNSGSDQLRLALMPLEEEERLRLGQPHRILAGTEPSGPRTLNYRVPTRGDYAVVLDNRASKSNANVHLYVSLDFAEPEVTRIEPRRQLTVILLSFAFFFAVVTFSARKLLRGVKAGEKPVP
jgi:hypothetical protein